MLQISGLSKAYGKNTVLDSITLTVGDGECLGLAGENSCGKTTLISIVAGLIAPDNGSVEIDGSVALVPQQLNLSPNLTVRENLTLWYAAYKLPAADLFAPHSLETRLELLPYARTRVSKLSGGRQKRLAIVTALLGNPQALLLDEPFNMLDLWGRRELAQLLEEQKSLGRAILLTAHQPLELATLCDRVALMREGKIATVLELAGKGTAEIAEQLAHYSNKDF